MTKSGEISLTTFEMVYLCKTHVQGAPTGRFLWTVCKDPETGSGIWTWCMGFSQGKLNILMLVRIQWMMMIMMTVKYFGVHLELLNLIKTWHLKFSQLRIFNDPYIIRGVISRHILVWPFSSSVVLICYVGEDVKSFCAAWWSDFYLGITDWTNLYFFSYEFMFHHLYGSFITNIILKKFIDIFIYFLLHKPVECHFHCDVDRSIVSDSSTRTWFLVVLYMMLIVQKTLSKNLQMMVSTW